MPMPGALICVDLPPSAVSGCAAACRGRRRCPAPVQPSVISTAPLATFRYRAGTYRGVRPHTVLSRSDATGWEVTRVASGGRQVRVTSIERTLIDVLACPLLGAGLEEIWRASEAVTTLNLDAMAAYVALLDDASLRARVGFYLDDHRDVWGLTLAELQRFASGGGSSAGQYYLDVCGRDRASTLVEAWNVIVPDQVLHRLWEEAAWI